jgi:tetratricopeptide (TPR) repeat protein
MQQTQISGNANAELYNMLGTAFFEKQNYTQARASFEKGLEKDTTNYSLYLNYGNVLAVTNNFPQALNAFLHSYQLNSTNPQISYFIAITYNKLGDTINTNKFFDQYKSLSK